MREFVDAIIRDDWPPSVAYATMRDGLGTSPLPTWKPPTLLTIQILEQIGSDPDGLGGIGRLLLAARHRDGLIYVGGVGTGFTSSTATALRKQMDAIAVTSPSIDTGKKRRNVVWLRPDLVAEIEFRAWTGDGKLRHASYKGLRDKSDAADVYEKQE